MPVNRGEGKRGEVFDDCVHGAGCPVEQVRKDTVDGFAPEEEPPEDGCPHQKIDEGDECEVADDGEQRNTSEVMGNEWGRNKGANQSNQNETP